MQGFGAQTHWFSEVTGPQQFERTKKKCPMDLRMLLTPFLLTPLQRDFQTMLKNGKFLICSGLHENYLMNRRARTRSVLQKKGCDFTMQPQTPHLSGQTLLLRVDFGVNFCSFFRGFAKGRFPKGWFWRMFPRNENRNEGTFAKTTLLETALLSPSDVFLVLTKGWFPKGWFRRMFPRNGNRNEGTFAKTTLLRNRPFISQWFLLVTLWPFYGSTLAKVPYSPPST